jgi:hypothetical protein
MTTNKSEDLNPSAFFTQILLQSGQYSSTNPQQPTLQSDAEKLLINFASLFAEELVTKSSSIAQRRTETSANSININDVNFVLKHQWPIYDNSSYNQISEN